MKKIYVVEDDDNIRELLVYALTSADYDARGFPSGAELAPELRAAPPDLLLLDIMMPGDDGISILKRLRASRKTEKLPVIMLTAKSAEYDRVRGLDLGADDYVTKPFSVMEVLARVRAVLRRSATDENVPGEFHVCGISLNVSRHSVRANNEEISLTYKEFELLRYLMLNEGIVLSRDRILGSVWDMDSSIESRTVDMHIKSLRQKLGGCGDAIKTIRNVGYKIVDNYQYG